MSNELKTKLAYQRFENTGSEQDYKVASYNLLAWSWEVLAESREMAAKVWKVSHFEQVLSRLYLEGGRDRCRAWVHENQGAIKDLGLQELCRAAYLNIVKN